MIAPRKLPTNIKACIALTSWKARINTVGLTIFNLLQRCGANYHIVLTLSVDEFPQKEASLPTDLNQMLTAGLFELIWVTKNYKSFKKWLFCSARYPHLPTISADDDCIYTRNYADELYQMWDCHKEFIVCNSPGMKYGISWPNGPYTIYPPNVFNTLGLRLINHPTILSTNNDDAFYGCLAHKMHINIIGMYAPPPIIFHDNVCGLGDGPNRYNAESDIEKIKGVLNELNWK